MATFYQVALTTGARVGEICKLRWTDVNTESSTISINNAEKGSNNRTIPVPTKTITMINALSKKHDQYLFNTHSNTKRMNHCNLRRKLAEKEKNPRFNQIKLHTFRHFFAREKIRQGFKTEYVQQLLGHRSILNTERYTKMMHYGNEKYSSEVADTVEKARQLAEDGWTFFVEIEGVKIFRKPQ
jgi:integrase